MVELLSSTIFWLVAVTAFFVFEALVTLLIVHFCSRDSGG
jgi:hypothetical protein